ncbi:hypothetical protein ScPMuIL_004858 [Solemya velum]
MATLNTKHTKRKYNGNRTHSDNITRKYRKRKPAQGFDDGKEVVRGSRGFVVGKEDLAPSPQRGGTFFQPHTNQHSFTVSKNLMDEPALKPRDLLWDSICQTKTVVEQIPSTYGNHIPGTGSIFQAVSRSLRIYERSLFVPLTDIYWANYSNVQEAQYSLVLLVSTGADELPQSDTISTYAILIKKIAVLEHTYEQELKGLREILKKQQGEIETLQITQEQFRSDFEEYLNVTLSRLAEHEHNCTINPEVAVVNRTGPALNVTGGFYLRNGAFHVTRTATVDICARECLFHNLCHSLNYDTTSQLCTLNAVSRNCARHHKLEEKKTSVYLEVQDIPMDYAGNCRNHDCAYGDRCEASQTTGYACARQGLELDFIKHYPGDQKHASCYVTGRERVVRLDCSEYKMNEQPSDYCPTIRLGSDSSSLCDPSIGTLCSSSDCLHPGYPYMGHRTCTLSGYTCQRWDVFQPHNHKYNASNRFPDAYISAANNYCRDPSNTGMPWCYTTDPGVRWQFCDIPVCPWATESCCGVSETHKHNLSSVDLICETETAVCDGTNMYVGNLSYTINGDQCRRWDIDLPHASDLWDPALFPDVDVHAANNYCRNVGENYTWCYTMNPGVKWDYCATPC